MILSGRSDRSAGLRSKVAETTPEGVVSFWTSLCVGWAHDLARRWEYQAPIMGALLDVSQRSTSELLVTA